MLEEHCQSTGRDGTQRKRPAPANVEERTRYPQKSDLDGSGQGGQSEKGGNDCALFSPIPLLIVCMKLLVVLNRD